jgi:hypothetical protein
VLYTFFDSLCNKSLGLQDSKHLIGIGSFLVDKRSKGGGGFGSILVDGYEEVYLFGGESSMSEMGMEHGGS